jgi:RNase P/RNase MRP subunit POP5
MRVKPSKRPKKRYIVFEVISQQNSSSIQHAIKKSVLNVLGNSYNEAGIRFLKDKQRLNRGIIRVNNKFSKDVINAINKVKSIKTLGMSGILKKAEEKYFRIAG